MSLSTGYSMTPADYAAMNNGCCNGNGGWGWGNDWWMLVLFILGWGNGGWGFGGNRSGNCGCGGGCATTADVNSAVNQQTIIGKLDGITQGICDATYALNNTANNGFSQAELSRCNQQAALMQQLYNMAAQNQQCCCETQRLIERVGCDTNYNLATQGTAIQSVISNSTRDIIENNNNNTRALTDMMVQFKLDAKDQQINDLQRQVATATQNAYIGATVDAAVAEIIRRTGRDCPVPAYVVPNPNCCYGNPIGVGVGYGYGYNNGCNTGCGCCA